MGDDWGEVEQHFADNAKWMEMLDKEIVTPLEAKVKAYERAAQTRRITDTAVILMILFFGFAFVFTRKF
jgi:hypothetical protein